MPKEIRLNAFDMNCVGHIQQGLWTHPRDQSTRYRELHYWTDYARRLEAGLFDGIFFADVVGVYAALDQAFRRARDGRGPGLVEVVATRLQTGEQSTDVPAHRDPLERLRRHLDREKQWTPTFQDVIEAEVRGVLDRAFSHAQKQAGEREGSA